MYVLASRLGRMGFDVEVLGYRSKGRSLDDMANEIEASLPTRFAGRFDIVAHSLGGLVGHQLCKKLGPTSIKRMVMLGSPLLGSRFAEIMIRSRSAEWMYGPIWHDLRPDVRLEHDQTVDGVEYGMIAGVIPGSRYLPRGETDGLIRLSATRAKMLKEHMVLNASHAMLLINKSAAENAARFLIDGSFHSIKRDQAPVVDPHQLPA
jgi:pimeloyl-ACP methyl ester carboxylesterase